MTSVAYYDLKLHQMDVKTAFLNGNLEDDVYMDQQWGLLKNERNTWYVKLRN